MSRTYPREDARYDYDILQLMVTDGFAVYYPAADVYVLKTESGSVAVRPHQVIHPAEKADIFRTVAPSLEPVRAALAEQAAPRTTRTTRKGWVSEQEQDDILRHFGL